MYTAISLLLLTSLFFSLSLSLSYFQSIKPAHFLTLSVCYERARARMLIITTKRSTHTKSSDANLTQTHSLSPSSSSARAALAHYHPRRSSSSSSETQRRKQFNFISTITYYVGPVSYTHLDVYKRQVLGKTRYDKLANNSIREACYNVTGIHSWIAERRRIWNEHLSLIHI